MQARVRPLDPCHSACLHSHKICSCQVARAAAQVMRKIRIQDKAQRGNA